MVPNIGDQVITNYISGVVLGMSFDKESFVIDLNSDNFRGYNGGMSLY